MMTAAQHRVAASLLRQEGTAKAVEIAEGHEQVARLIDHRNGLPPR
jgi:hypothetical protein